MLIEPRKFSTWAPGEIRDGVYVPPELKGTITDAGEYIPPETEEPDENNRNMRQGRIPLENDTNYLEQTERVCSGNRRDTISNEKKQTRPKRDTLRIVFRVSALSLSMVASVLSAWFSFGHIAQYLPFPIALFLSGIVVFSATLAPELIILCYRKRRFVLMVCVGFVGIVASAYSMTTTIAGQYDSRKVEDVAQIKSERGGNERARILAEIDRLNVSIDTYQARITRATNDGKTDANATTLKKQDEAKKAEYEIRFYDMDGMSFQGNAIERKSFYDWIGRVISIDGDAVEFGASVLPALLLDIAAPVFAVVFMVI